LIFGFALATLRVRRKEIPVALSMTHGFLAAGALTLLLFRAFTEPVSAIHITGCSLLVVAFALGLTAHFRRKTIVTVYGHALAAMIGFTLVVATL